ncbi:MAG: hypothetical protein AAB681_02290 [Patescibacteria group bacterium]
MKQTSLQTGFTLIETLVAVLILTMSIGSLLSLAAGGFYSVRYARNQIVANNLLQESLEYVRNSRDSAFINGLTWTQWQDTLQTDISGNQTGIDTDGCFSTDGCIVNPYTAVPEAKKCSGACPFVLYFPDNSFYGYSATYPFTPTTAPYQTSFVRKIVITMSPYSTDQVVVTSSISWLNGVNTRGVSQSMLITNWKP